MSPIGVAFLILLAWGIYGMAVFRSAFWKTAAETVDHPSDRVRWINRFGFFGMAFFASFLTSPFLIISFVPAIDLRSEPELVRLAAGLAYPVPLAVVFYILLVKLKRWRG